VNGALGNPRERILSAVVNHPGVHLRELPRIVGFSLRAIRYHLEGMRRDDLVVSQRTGRFLRFFPRGAYSGQERALIAAVRVRAQREVLRVLLSKGPQRFSEAAAVLRTAGYFVTQHVPGDVPPPSSDAVVIDAPRADAQHAWRVLLDAAVSAPVIVSTLIPVLFTRAVIISPHALKEDLVSVVDRTLARASVA